MDRALVLVEAPAGRRAVALALAARVAGDVSRARAEEAPDVRPLLAAGDNVLFLPWSETLLAEGFPEGLVADVAASCEACSADIVLPDQAWLPGVSFAFFSKRLAGREEELHGAGPIPGPAGFEACRLSLHVPSAAIVARDARLRSHHLGRPRGIHMAIAEKCDMGCVMCPYYGSDRPPDIREHYEAYMRRRSCHDLLDLPGFIALLGRAAGLQPVRSVSIFGPGEPLRNKDFLSILRFCAERGLAVDIATNGKYLSDEVIDALPGLSLRTVILSVDAATPETYSAIKASGDYTRLLGQATRLREAAERGGGFSVKASFVRQERNAHEEKDFLRRWEGVADEAVFTSRYFMGRPAHPPLWTAPARLPCASLGMGVHILTNGDCWSCSAGAPDTFSLGNILRDDPGDILKTQRRLVAAHLDTGAAGPLCLSCEWWRQAQRCEEYEAGKVRRVLRPYSTSVPLGMP